MKIFVWATVIGAMIFMIVASVILWKVVLCILGALLVVFFITWFKYQEYLANVRKNLETNTTRNFLDDFF